MSQDNKVIAAQAWYWSVNSVIIDGKKVLNDEAKDTFLRIYKGQIPDGMTTIGCDYVFNFLNTDSKRLLSEEDLTREIPITLDFFNIWSLIIKLSDNTKKNNLVNKISSWSSKQIKLISGICEDGKNYNTNDVVEFIVKNICDISTSVGKDQEDEAIEFCQDIQDLVGQRFNANLKKQIRRSFSQYRNVQVLISYPESYNGESKNIQEFFEKELETNEFCWVLKSLQDLKVSRYYIDLHIEDILNFFRKKSIIDLETNHSTKVFAGILLTIKTNPSKYFLGQEIYQYFDELYDLEASLNSIKEDNYDLTPYRKILKHEFLKDFSSDLVNQIKILDERNIDLLEDICKKVKNGEKSFNKLEILISIKNYEVRSFIRIVNDIYPDFFSEVDIDNFDIYSKTISNVIQKNNMYEYLEENLTAANLSSVLRALQVTSLISEDKIELSELLFLLSRRNIIILSSNDLENELKVIAQSPDSYYYGEKIINYFKKMYNYDATLENDNLELKVHPNRMKDTNIYMTNYEDEGIDLLTKALEEYNSLDKRKHKVKDVIIFILNYTYKDKDTGIYYKFKASDERKAAKLILSSNNVKIPDDFTDIFTKIKGFKANNIVKLLKSCESFKDVLEILEMYKSLNCDKLDINEEVLKELDECFVSKEFYKKSNYLSLSAFYNELSNNNDKYAYASEFCSFYKEKVKQFDNKTDEFDENPVIEKVEAKGNEDTLGYKIINRVMPMEKAEKKKALTAIISGIGVISFLLMTAVLAKNPLESIEQCATSFKGLFTNLSLSNIKNAIGNPVLYFASIYESFRLVTRHRFMDAKNYIQEEMNRSK